MKILRWPAAEEWVPLRLQTGIGRFVGYLLTRNATPRKAPAFHPYRDSHNSAEAFTGTAIYAGYLTILVHALLFARVGGWKSLALVPVSLFATVVVEHLIMLVHYVVCDPFGRDGNRLQPYTTPAAMSVVAFFALDHELAWIRCAASSWLAIVAVNLLFVTLGLVLRGEYERVTRRFEEAS